MSKGRLAKSALLREPKSLNRSVNRATITYAAFASSSSSSSSSCASYESRAKSVPRSLVGPQGTLSRTLIWCKLPAVMAVCIQPPTNPAIQSIIGGMTSIQQRMNATVTTRRSSDHDHLIDTERYQSYADRGSHGSLQRTLDEGVILLDSIMIGVSSEAATVKLVQHLQQGNHAVRHWSQRIEPRLVRTGVVRPCVYTH